MKTEFEKYTYSSDVIESQRQIDEIISENAADEMSFGISFLDEALVGIQKNDLILLGAPSGAGKTELATHIALSNVRNGKRVVYFALEAEKKEIELRISYKNRVIAYLKNGGKSFPSYDLWVAGRCGYINDGYKPSEKMDRDKLRTRYVSGEYTIKNFLMDYTEVVNNSDLVILDHVHYFDLESENENKEYKNIIKEIRSQVLEYGKPIIVISHIRKRDRHYPSLAPDQEDFHGTSDLVKIATKVISISPQYESNIFISEGDTMRECVESGYTFMKIAKNRRNGSVTRHIAAIKFDRITNSYNKSYFIGSQKTIDKKQAFVTDDIAPLWAASAK